MEFQLFARGVILLETAAVIQPTTKNRAMARRARRLLATATARRQYAASLSVDQQLQQSGSSVPMCGDISTSENAPTDAEFDFDHWLTRVLVNTGQPMDASWTLGSGG